MLKKNKFFLLLILLIILPLLGLNSFENDIIDLGGKTLSITFIGHGTLMMEYDGKIIHIDPVSRYGDYLSLPKADIILITHAHGDHLDKDLVASLTKSDTVIIGNQEVKNEIGNIIVMKNGETLVKKEIQITAVPAYNITEGRDKYHPKGRDNGYILQLNNKNVYIAGDSENTTEMLALKNIEIAFLPMNQPYTMTPEQVAEVAKAMKPKILYPYHFGNTDTKQLLSLLKDLKEVEVRIRNMN